MALAVLPSAVVLLKPDEYEDPGSGLVYLRGRDYDPETRRFLSMDPAHVWNKYDFADGNPVMNIDPSGHTSVAGSVASYVLNSLALVVSTAALLVEQPEVFLVITEEMITTAGATGAGSATAGLTSQALVDAHAVGADSSAARALNITSLVLSVPGLVVTAVQAGAFIAGKLARLKDLKDGVEYVMKVAKTREAARREVNTWNTFYEIHNPFYVGAKLLRDGRYGRYFKRPFIPHDYVVTSSNLPKILASKDGEAFFDFVLLRDLHLFESGAPPITNPLENGGIVARINPGGKTEFFQTNFSWVDRGLGDYESHWIARSTLINAVRRYIREEWTPHGYLNDMPKDPWIEEYIHIKLMEMFRRHVMSVCGWSI